MIKHMLATEAIMRALARKLGEDEEEWGITGLIHDIDIELVEGDMSSHGKLGSDLARELEPTGLWPMPFCATTRPMAFPKKRKSVV